MNQDCICSILKFVNNGLTYKSIITLSKYINQYLEKYRIFAIKKYSKHLQTLITMYPNKDWDWIILPKHNKIT